MKSYLLSGLLLSSFLVFTSCSSSGGTVATTASSGSSFYPAWYSSTQEFSQSADSTFFLAYGLAVAADSAEAADKARTEAALNMEQHISEALESIRAEAAEQNGDLAEPAFIFELRRAESAVSGAAEVTETAVRQNETYGSYHGFAEVRISREALLRELDGAFSAQENTWEAMKATAAFTGW